MLADAVLVTGPMAFSAAQIAIGTLQFMPLLADMTPGDALGDPAGCLRGAFTTTPLKDLLLRQIRCTPVSPRVYACCPCKFTLSQLHSSPE